MSKKASKTSSVSIIIILFMLTILAISRDRIINSPKRREGTSFQEKNHSKTSDNKGVKKKTEEMVNIPSAAKTSAKGRTKASKPPVKVRALYLTGWSVGSIQGLNHFTELANETEINSYVVDVKDDDGYVGYKSEIEAVKEINAWKQKYNVEQVLKQFHKNNINVIGRIVCFKDPVLSFAKPDLAIKYVGGGIWKDNNGLSWLNPYNKHSWSYLVDIAKEAVKKGFDEIQFDYVRFANDGARSTMYFDSPVKKKYEVIDEFLAYAKKELPGVKISADVFGIICESPEDTEDIGQYLEFIGKDIDYISPMVYPSHYAPGQIVNKTAFPKPDTDPYNVVYQTLIKAKDRISKVQEYRAKVRPYLQDFTATWLGRNYYITYGPKQVRQQIEAVYAAGCDEWIMWDAGNTYSETAFLNDTVYSRKSTK